MTKIPGVSFQSDAKGKVKKVTFDIAKHGDFIEDYLDGLKADELLKNGEFVSHESVLEEHEKLKRKGK